MTSRKTKLHQIHGIVGRHATLLNSDVTYPWKGSLEFSYLMHIFTNKIIKYETVYIYRNFCIFINKYYFLI